MEFSYMLDKKDFKNTFRVLKIGAVSHLSGDGQFTHHMDSRIATNLLSSSANHLYRLNSNTGDLIKKIQEFHSRYDGVNYSQNEIFVGAGASTLVTTQLAMIKSLGYDKLYYFSPVYHSIHLIAKLFDLELCSVNDGVNSSDSMSFVLPEEKACLFITDPLLCIGHSMNQELMDTLKAWQKRTQSHIWVDGVWQYLKWDEHDRSEHSAHLDRELTFRTISPCKQMGLHGLRFAYQLVPERDYQKFSDIHISLNGSLCFYSYQAALALMDQLNSESGNRNLIAHAKHNYHQLKEAGYIEDLFVPKTGYMVMMKFNHPDRHKAVVGESYFIESGGNHSRINLLFPKDHWDM